MYCACRYDATALLRDLDPYEHLRRFYRLCLVHYKRNIRGLRGQIPKDVEIAIKVEKRLQARLLVAAWLKDKIEGTKFALPALHQPNSLIPFEIWKASPTTTNGNEQAHRNINRDGVGLTLLGIMRGFHYDTNICASLDLSIYLPMLTVQNELLPDKSLPSEGNTSFACVGLTLPSVEAQPPNSLLMPSSTVIPVSTFSTLTYALTAGARVTDHRARSPSLVPHLLPHPQYISIFLPLETN
ncbi:hypothetical protein BDR07DRAFT_1400262 [Suillus spraguei]|nr:hypothetical protein BDR07DRAFT_1400262 [Suillus spraguei]